MEIEHQLKHRDFYIPNWPLKYLFLGTFNPSGGEEVNYYYGRGRNRLWELLSNIFSTNLDPRRGDFLSTLKTYKIGCMDMIDSISIPENQLDFVLGKGYQDSKIINNKVERMYNTKTILRVIERNHNIKVYSTWGKGSTLKEWKNEVNKITDLASLASPSMAARVPKGELKYEYMLRDWRDKIKLNN